ncbi:efflux RND transporter permease subunit, partial [Aliarcobacter butzleri]
AICATFLKPHNSSQKQTGPIVWFNNKFDSLTRKYKMSIFNFINKPLKWMTAYIVIIAITILFFLKLPTGFVPSEDQGDLMIQFTLPVGAS